MLKIPFFHSPYDWITIIVGLIVTVSFYYKYFKVYKSQQLLNSLPGIWTSLGLLFTFFAICSSMQELQNISAPIESLEGEVLQKVGTTAIDITKIIGDIIPAFTTSILGLVAALAITIANKIVYFCDEEKEALNNETPEDYIIAIKNILVANQKTMEGYHKNLNDNVSHQNEILQGFIKGFVERMDGIFKEMNGAIKQQIHDFGEEQFAESSKVLNGIIEKLSNQSASILQEQKESIKAVVEATSKDINGISSKLTDVVESLSKDTSTALNNLGEKQAKEFQGIVNRYDVFAEKLISQNKTFAIQMNEQMANQFETIEKKNNESLERMVALKDSYQEVCANLLSNSTQANQEVIKEIKESFGNFISGLHESLTSQCTILSKAIEDNVKTLNDSYSFMSEHLAEIIANYEQSALAFKDAVNIAHRTNETSENTLDQVTRALENMSSINENIEKVIASVAEKQANMDKIIANIKEMNGAIEALQQLESTLNRISKK